MKNSDIFLDINKKAGLKDEKNRQNGAMLRKLEEHWTNNLSWLSLRC